MYKLGFCVYGPQCRFKHTRLPGPPPDPAALEAAKPREHRNINLIINAGAGPASSGDRERAGSGSGYGRGRGGRCEIRLSTSVALCKVHRWASLQAFPFTSWASPAPSVGLSSSWAVAVLEARGT